MSWVGFFLLFPHHVQKQPFKAADDKLLMNKFIRQKFGGGLMLKTLYLERLGADSV